MKQEQQQKQKTKRNKRVKFNALRTKQNAITFVTWVFYLIQ